MRRAVLSVCCLCMQCTASVGVSRPQALSAVFAINTPCRDDVPCCSDLGLPLAVRYSMAAAAIAAYTASTTTTGTQEQAAMALVRRVVALAVPRLILKSLPLQDRSEPNIIVTDTGVAHDQAMPWTVWPIVETVMVVTTWLVAIAFIKRQADRAGGAQEIARLLQSVQWLFADAAGMLVMDRSVKRYATIAAIILLPRLIQQTATAANSAAGVLVQTVCMSWVNIVVNMFIGGSVSATVRAKPPCKSCHVHLPHSHSHCST